MNEYVFPQTPSKDPNFNREGGLTKRELFAAMLLSETLNSFKSVKDASTAAIAAAEILLLELKRTEQP